MFNSNDHKGLKTICPPYVSREYNVSYNSLFFLRITNNQKLVQSNKDSLIALSIVNCNALDKYLQNAKSSEWEHSRLLVMLLKRLFLSTFVAVS